MAKLKLGRIADDKPVKLTVELPATVHRDLVAYAEVLARTTGNRTDRPAKLSRRCWSDSWQPTGLCKGAAVGVIDVWLI